MNLPRLSVSGRSGLSSVAKVFLSSAAILLLSGPLFAQSNQGRILGTVRDQSGGTIAGATVTVTDTLKGVSRTLTTDEAGEYAAPNLDPSTYSVRVEFKGFRTYSREGMAIGVGQEAKVDVLMQPGEQAQTVTVTEDIPLVETTSATLTGNIETQKIADLPLNGRNFVNLLTLRPGYVNQPGGGGGNQAGMGLRPGDSMFLVDGLYIYEWGQGQQIVNGYAPAGDAATLLPIDAIQEFSIQQDPKAELGWKPGVQVNLALKAGTNSLHGTAYAFGRDAALSAENFFQPGPPVEKPPLSFEQYGATAGGPIKKDKIFWFLGFEAQQLSVGTTTTVNAPADIPLPGGNPALSMVDACNAVGRNNVTALSARLAGLPTGSCTPLPASNSNENVFATNPGNEFSDPTLVIPSGLQAVTDVNSTYNGLAKVDYHPNDKSTLSGMFFIGKGSGTWQDNPANETSAWSESFFPVSDRLGSGSWTYVPNSAIVNELKVGYTYYTLPFLSADHTANPAAPWGISNGIPTGYAINTGVTDKTFFGFPRINFQSNVFTQLGGNWPKFVGPDANTEFLDHISYLHGKHAFKFGGEYTFVETVSGATSNAKGLIKFKNTKLAGVTTTTLENFLLGNTASGSNIFVGNPTRDVHTNHFAAFFQDDYRMTPKLTVNIGVRYEVGSVWADANNQLGNFDPNSPTGLVQVGAGITSPYNPDHRDWSPRLGFAWDISGNQKTVVRAGASLLYEFVPSSAFLNSAGNATGLGKIPTGAELCTGGICTAGTGNIAAASFNPLPSTVTNGWQNNATTPLFQAGIVACGDGSTITSGPQALIGTQPAPCSTAGFERNLRTPYVETWNLDIQRAITPNLSLDVAYLGNHGVKIFGVNDINVPATGSGYSAGLLTACAANPANCPSPAAGDLPELGPYSAKFPYLQYIFELSNLDRSHYNAAQVTLTQRTSHGLSFTAAYTYSHALDDVSQNFGSSTPLNNADPGLNYGNSDYDIRNRFTFEATYAIPGRKTPGQILQGWQINSIVTLQPGTPWAVQDMSNDFSGTGEVNNPNTWGEAWDFFGNPKAFTATPNGIPFSGNDASGAILKQCTTAVTNHYSGQQQALALASLANFGCYASGSSVLTPPPYGSFGTIPKNIFLNPNFRTWDMSVQKDWKFKERLTAQFRAEFFNVLNHPLFGQIDAGHLTNNDPSAGGLPFGAANKTPDQAAGDPVLGSGSNRDIQLGLKLIF